MNRQIEEMIKAFDDYCNNEVPDEECVKYRCIDCHAKSLIKAGYRRASDVAREIVQEIKHYLLLNENIAKKCKEENGEQNREYFKGKLAAFLQIRGFIDVEFKKKYEGEGGG